MVVSGGEESDQVFRRTEMKQMHGCIASMSHSSESGKDTNVDTFVLE
jgi:hypothetical protein